MTDPKAVATPRAGSGAQDTVRPLTLISFLFDSRVGGPHVCARNISTVHIRHGHRARVAIPKGTGNARAFFEGKVPLDELHIRKPTSPRNIGPFLLFALSIPLGVWRVRRYLKSQQPDVVRVNGALDVVPVMAARLAGVPCVLYLNDTAFPRRVSGMFARFASVFGAQIVAAAKRVAEHHGYGDAPVIHEPVDTSAFVLRDLTAEHRPTTRLGLIANWNPIKDQGAFISAIQELSKATPVEGRIIGGFLENQESYWRPLLDRITDLGLDRHISMPGFVDDIPAELQRIDILLLTSQSEACPVCVLEAMASGVPVVSFDVGGVPEMLGVDGADPAGIVVPKGDVAAMVSAVKAVIHDRARYRRMALAGRDRAVTHFELEKCALQHERMAIRLRRN